MKKTTFTLLLALFCCRLAAQCPTNVTFSTQAQVDLFAVNYPDCDSIQGNLKIGPSTDITDLSALAGIRFVKKNIVITGNSALTTLAGLDSMQSFGQSPFHPFDSRGDSLVVRNNDMLVNLSGFGNTSTTPGTATKITTKVIVADNDALTNLEGLEFLIGTGFYDYSFDAAARVGGLTVKNNPALASLHGLDGLSRGIVDITDNDNLQNLEGFGNSFGDMPNTFTELNITGNDALPDLSGLDYLTNINSLNIAGNDNLETLSGLGSLANVNGGWGCEQGWCSPDYGLAIRQNKKLPSLKGLENLKTVAGYLHIVENEQLTGLAGLDSLRFLHEGHLELIGNPMLLNIDALSNLESIGPFTAFGEMWGGYVYISENARLSNLNGLHQIDSLGSDLIIHENDALHTLAGLESIQKIGGGLYIAGNDSLKNFEGLENLRTIGKDLAIGSEWSDVGNIALTSLKGLEQIQSIGGSLLVYLNSALTSLSELTNVQSLTGDLSIHGNDALTSLSGLENLQSVGGSLLIEDNITLMSMAGLGGLQSIGSECYITGNAALTSLAALQHIENIEGNMTIGGNNALTSLTGLNNLQSVDADLLIDDNIALMSLAGLDSLQSIGGEFYITDNTALTSLTGLNNLQSVDSDLLIKGNNSLQSLNGLERLKRLGTGPGSKFKLTISSNTNLESLYGLDSLDYATVRELFLFNNPKLSVCEVRPVCDYVKTSFPATIYGNAPGCSNKQEIKAACQTSSSNDLSAANPIIQVYPNPANEVLNIQVNDAASWQIALYDLQGRLLYRQTLSGGSTIEVDGWPAGLYVLRAVSGERFFSGKIGKQ